MVAQGLLHESAHLGQRIRSGDGGAPPPALLTPKDRPGPGRGLVAQVVGHDDRAGHPPSDVDLDLVPLAQVAVQERQPDGAHALLIGLYRIDAVARAQPVGDHRPAGDEAGRLPAAQHPSPGPGDALVHQRDGLHQPGKIGDPA